MISIASTSRSLFRIPRTWQFPRTSNFILNRFEQLQGFHCYHGLNWIRRQEVPKGTHSLIGWNKKRKSVTPVWRQISTQSVTTEEGLMEDVVVEPKNIARFEQAGEHESDIVSVMKAVADSTLSPSSSSLPENESGEAEEMVVRPSSISQNDGLKGAKEISEDCTAGSASQNVAGVEDTGTDTIISREKHAVSLEVGASVIRFIRGKDGSTQKSIEDMGVKIIFPSSKKEDSVLIVGDSMDVITKASEKIQAAINEEVKSPTFAYSHFISLPLAVHPELVDKLYRFQTMIVGDGDAQDVNGKMDENSVELASEGAAKVEPRKEPSISVNLKVEDETDHGKVDVKSIPIVSYVPKAAKSPTSYDLGIDKSIFQKPERIHLTLLMLKLWNKERIHAAANILQSVSTKVNEVLGNRPLFVRLKGLDCIRGSRAKAEVLYAPVEEIGNEGRLLSACQIIIDAFVKAGLVLENDAHHKLKLHATVMNTTFRRRKRMNKRKKDFFDARGIFEQFGSEMWGDYHISEAHLSQRFVYDDNGYYHCCGSIVLPADSQAGETSATQNQTQTVEVELPVADSA